MAFLAPALPAITAASGVAAAGASFLGASNSAKSAKQAAALQAQYAGQNQDQQQQYLDFLQGNFEKTAAKTDELVGNAQEGVSTAYDRVKSIIAGIPGVSDLFGEGKDLSRKDFDYRTGLKRDNLDFILGDNKNILRDIQGQNATLAGLQEGGFVGGVDKILRSSLLDLKASTLGEPTGTFANLSAQNLQRFSQQGLSNFLGINDFFAKEGTVDPVSPLQTAFQLFGTREEVAKLGIQNEQFQADSLIKLAGVGSQAQQGLLGAAGNLAQLGIGSSNQYYNSLSNVAGAGAAADAAKYNGIVSGLGVLNQSLLSASSINNQNQALANQRSNQQQVLSLLNARSLNTFAPTSTPSYSFSPSTGITQGNNSLTLPSSGGQASNALFPASSSNWLWGN